MYAALLEQPKLGRSQDELSPEELPLYQHFSSKEYIDKLVAFLTLEDQKGKDRFNSRNFTLFKVGKSILCFAELPLNPLAAGG